ncbi:hypothetical protein JL721_6122 [Aureococcus anophagefferens]|nr:hypothetical protein JL721_6122 [Aureococcus anophagefferens]
MPPARKSKDKEYASARRRRSEQEAAARAPAEDRDAAREAAAARRSAALALAAERCGETVPGRETAPSRALVAPQNAVHAAAATDAVPCLRLLLDAGADATARNAQGFAPLALAASRSASLAAAALALELEARGLVAAGALDARRRLRALHWACVNDLPDAARQRCWR